MLHTYFSIINLGLLLPEYNINNRGFHGHYQQQQEKQDTSKFLVYLIFLDIGLHIFPLVDTYISHDSWDVSAHQIGNARVLYF
jgi:hypothetical protein